MAGIWNRMRAWKIAAALIAVCLAGLALVAVALGGLQTSQSARTIPGRQSGSATAHCARGSETVSGGFATPAFDPQGNGPAIFTQTSMRKRTRHWKSTGANLGNSDGKLLAFAYCDLHSPGLKVRSHGTTVTGGQTGSVEAKCPKGSEAVSGGFSQNGAIFTFASRRVNDRTWKVAGYNNRMQDAQLRAFAYCDKHQPNLKPRAKTSSSIPPDSTGSVSVKCRHGGEARSGGFTGSVDNNARGAFPFVSRRKGSSRWKAAAFGNTPGGGPLTVIAYCKR